MPSRGFGMWMAMAFGAFLYLYLDGLSGRSFYLWDCSVFLGG